MARTTERTDQELIVTGRFSPEGVPTAPSGFEVPARRRLSLRWPTRPSTTVAVLLLAALSLLILDMRGGNTAWLRDLGTRLGGSAQVWADERLGPVLDQPIRRVDVSELEGELEQLRAERLRLRTENDVLAEQLAGASDPVSPAGLAGVGELKQTRVVAADTRATHAGVFTIALGSQDGVTDDMAVLADSGLIGRTTEVGPVSSQVQLLTDAASGVSVRDPRTGERGIIRGTGGGLRLTLVDPFAEIAAGQTLVTVGSAQNRPYPAGLPVGDVAELLGVPGDLNREALVEPAVDFSVLDSVAVLIPAGAVR
ncbi:MAG: hypothetical protein KDC39_11115 [Actinobacteria bacterium]|nr:hypothetical protein [Actinomycetota bacterium]